MPNPSRSPALLGLDHCRERAVRLREIQSATGETPNCAHEEYLYDSDRLDYLIKYYHERFILNNIAALLQTAQVDLRRTGIHPPDQGFDLAGLFGAGIQDYEHLPAQLVFDFASLDAALTGLPERPAC